MKKSKFYYKITALMLVLLMAVGCERKLDELQLATKYPTTPEVFIDGFSSGLIYAAFAGSKPTAFQVDDQVTYLGTNSMRFDVPNATDPLGGYAGGAFFLTAGRDLSGYNVLTFWAKAYQADTINEVGFGNDLGANKYQVSVSNLEISTTWEKYYILIPDPSLLKQEKGMFYYAAAPQSGKAYSFYIDEVKFEKLGTINHEVYKICNGSNLNVTGSTGTYKLSDFSATFNLPTGLNQTETISSSYFTFTSSNTSVATVDSKGVVSLIGNGTAKITAKVGNVDAVGSYTITTGGPTSTATNPTLAQANVISVYSDAYTNNVTIDDYCEHWEWGVGLSWHQIITTEYSFGSLNGNNFIHYSNNNDTWGLKRVIAPIKFKSNPKNVSSMTYLHYDVWVPSMSTYTSNIPTIGLQDAAGLQVGVTATSPLETNKWVPVEIPLSSFGIDKTKVAYFVFDNFPSDIYVDNIYFHN